MADNSMRARDSSADRFQIIMILIATGFFVALISFIGYLRLGPHIAHYFSSIPFESNGWKRTVNSYDPVRLHMVDDLIATRKLVGMPRAEIDSLLGVPPKTPFFAKYDYVYWLGPERSFIKIDSEWLGIRFENNHVVEVKLLND